MISRRRFLEFGLAGGLAVIVGCNGDEEPATTEPRETTTPTARDFEGGPRDVTHFGTIPGYITLQKAAKDSREQGQGAGMCAIDPDYDTTDLDTVVENIGVLYSENRGAFDMTGVVHLGKGVYIGQNTGNISEEYSGQVVQSANGELGSTHFPGNRKKRGERVDRFADLYFVTGKNSDGPAPGASFVERDPDVGEEVYVHYMTRNGFKQGSSIDIIRAKAKVDAINLHQTGAFYDLFMPREPSRSSPVVVTTKDGELLGIPTHLQNRQLVMVGHSALQRTVDDWYFECESNFPERNWMPNLTLQYENQRT